jgi:hypothetical protein
VLSDEGTALILRRQIMAPFVITIDEAAAPHASLAFWGEGIFSP